MIDAVDACTNELQCHLGEGAVAQNCSVVASEAVLTYLLQHALRRLPPPYTWLRAQQFDEDKLHTIQNGTFDLGIAWDSYSVFRDRIDRYRDLSFKVIAGSDATLQLLYHPLDPCARWVQSRMRPGLVEQFKNEIPQFSLIYPLKLPGVQHVAQCLVGPGGKCLPVEGFQTVVNLVQLQTGSLGLFPGWPWLLRKIEHETSIKAASILFSEGDLGLPKDVSLKLRLLSIQPKDHQNPQAERLVTALESALRNLQVGNERWETVAWNDPFEIRDGQPQRLPWDLYFINPGSQKDELKPHWRSGELFGLHFDPVDGAESKKLTVRGIARINAFSKGRTDEEQHKYWDYQIQGILDDDSFSFNGTYEAIQEQHGLTIQKPLSKRTFISIAHRIQKKGHRGVYLLGIIQFLLDYDAQEPGFPILAPIILCSDAKALLAEDFEQISELIRFLPLGSYPEAVLQEKPNLSYKLPSQKRGRPKRRGDSQGNAGLGRP